MAHVGAYIWGYYAGYRGNGKENGNYYLGFRVLGLGFKDYLGILLEAHRDIGIWGILYYLCTRRTRV